MRKALFAAALLAASQHVAAFTFLARPAQPLSRPADAAPSAVTARPLVYLAPFEDARRNKALYRGVSALDEVWADSEGRTLLAREWGGRRGDLSYLMHRQLLASLVNAGYRVAAPEVPVSLPQALAEAVSRGASALVTGSIEAFEFKVTGADLLGTSITGTRYSPQARLSVLAFAPATGKRLWEREVVESMDFESRVPLGDERATTFPVFFEAFMPLLGMDTADLSSLREIGGLPALPAAPLKASATPTPTPQPIVVAAPAVPAATPVGGTSTAKAPVPITVTPTAAPTAASPASPKEPAVRGRFKCPRCGRNMDDNWQMCPWDATPRSRFLLDE